ncbi:MAG TPA: 4-hydroxyphenylpyruvate dioxygenase [Ignavibacteriaceae bacterium]|nr:4-hydroxyphenylpyruvate dioxygenase [Ignavibacteriaceae bacterium]
MANQLNIKGYDYIEFYVGSAKMWVYWLAKTMAFDIVGYSGPETGVKDKASYFLVKNKIKLLISSALKPSNYEIASFIERHGDGVKRWSLSVENVKEAFDLAVKNGGIPVRNLKRFEDENGYIEEAAIKLYDDAEIVFINRDNYKGIFRPGFGKPIQKIKIKTQDSGLQEVDHIVGNVRTNEMNLWENYLNKTLNLETFLEFGAGDISTQYSALLSKVVRSKNGGGIKNPINEPYEGLKKSQIEEYIDEYWGSGIQHIAISTNNIIATIKALRENGVEFLTVPDAYYDILKEKKLSKMITENIDELKECGILCDTEGKGYLLQLFTKPIGDRPTFFFEIIQRREGAEGFGQGNFQALFESIERDQELRGSLDREE